MFWCFERKKTPVKVPCEVSGECEVRHDPPADPVDIIDGTVMDENTGHPPQRFPSKYVGKTWDRFNACNVGQGLLSGQTTGHIAWYLKMLRKGKARYQNASGLLMQKGIYVPWEIIGIIHGLEASFDFSKQVLNGQKYTQRTTWVPKRLGPWASWEESTVFAFTYDLGYQRLPQYWGVVECALFFERWNGMSYWMKGKPSPYLWGYSSVQVRGKFVEDGVYNSYAVTKQVGAMSQLIKIDFKFDPRGLIKEVA